MVYFFTMTTSVRRLEMVMMTSLEIIVIVLVKWQYVTTLYKCTRPYYYITNDPKYGTIIKPSSSEVS